MKHWSDTWRGHVVVVSAMVLVIALFAAHAIWWPRCSQFVRDLWLAAYLVAPVLAVGACFVPRSLTRVLRALVQSWELRAVRWLTKKVEVEE